MSLFEFVRITDSEVLSPECTFLLDLNRVCKKNSNVLFNVMNVTIVVNTDTNLKKCNSRSLLKRPDNVINQVNVSM